MKYISSSQNPQIKRLKGLQEKARKRAEHNQYVIEGTKELNYAIKAGYHFDEIFITNHTRSDQTERVIDSMGSNELIISEVAAPIFKTLCYRSTSEIIAIAQKKEHKLSDLLLNENPLILIAEAPEKPGNIGALARTVDAGNIDALIITDPKTELYNPNVIRSSVGCLFSIPIAITSNEELIQFLKDEDIKLLSAALSENATSYVNHDYTIPTAIAVGTEDQGLTDAWLRQSEHHIIIPMQGVNDSLNVSVAAGIILFEAVRQRNL